MTKFQERGSEIRQLAKQVVLDFMNSNTICGVSNSGMKQATIFRECGFDWGDYDKATSSRQQYWIVALLRELESEDKIEQVRPSGPWRLKKWHNHPVSPDRRGRGVLEALGLT